MNPANPPPSPPAPDEAQLPALGWLRHAHAEGELLAEVARHVARRRRRRFALGSVALALALAAGFAWRTRPAAPAGEIVASAAMVSAPERRTLADGSTVELKEGARITVDFSGALRRVTLAHGEAHFQVAKNPARPFVVAAAGVEVRAVGTAFAVQLGAGQVEVVVSEGRVAVGPTLAAMRAAPAAPTLLEAGSRCVFAADAPPLVRALTEAELAERLAWRIPQLEFSRTPLAEVVALMNRHNAVRFTVADAALHDVRLSGFLRADNTEGLVRILEANFGVRAERRDAEIILRR